MLLQVLEIGKNSESVIEKLKLAVLSSKLLCRILTEILSIYRLNKLYQIFSFPEFFPMKMYASYSWFQTFAVFWILYIFFWVFPRRPIVVCWRFGTLYLFHLHRLDMKCEVYFILHIQPMKCEVYFTLHIQPMKMELIECSETSAYNNQTQGKYPKEYIRVLYFLHTCYMLKGRPNVIPIRATKACGGSDDIAPLIPNYPPR